MGEGETGGGIFGDCVGRSRRETDTHTLSYTQMCKNCACVCVCVCLCLFLCLFVSVGLRERKRERGRKGKEGEREGESLQAHYFLTFSFELLVVL